IIDIAHFCLDYLRKTLDLYEIKYDLVIEVLKKENDLFYNTIKIGEKKVEEFLKKEKFITTEIAFKLYETYGFPLEITKEIVDPSLIKIDSKVFELLKQTHSKVSKSLTNLGLDMQFNFLTYAKNKLSEFIGYDYDEFEAKVIHQIYENNNYYVLLNKTPFYAAKGGQHSDFGWIDHQEVLNVISDKYENHWHVLKEKINQDKVIAKVDPAWRINAMRNHSATHLLGSAIDELFGKTIQIGSDNNPNRLTLDVFLEHKPDLEEIKIIEDKVNGYINKNYKREYIETTIENAKEMGAWLFENKLDKYNKKVRVVKFGDISKELCGGTHIPETKLIEKFKIIKLDSKGINKYRIEAITSFKTIEKYEQTLFNQELEKFTNHLKNIKTLKPSFEYNNNFKNYKEIQKANVELAKKYKKLIKDKSSQIVYKIDELNVKKVMNYDTYVDLNIESNDLKKLALFLKEELPNKIILVGKKDGDNTLIAIASNDGKALELFNHIIINSKSGNGGGNPHFAMGKITQINLNSWENSPST
ncbi:MAG: hypothetical protein E7Y34_01760, partial [Mycoplasma sp.]|nr:hypothetical protein [Mycoplasma sp.]